MPIAARKLLVVVLALVTLGGARAAPVAYTDPAVFQSAIAHYQAATEDFDNVAAGTAIPSGGSVGGLTFSFSFTGPPAYSLAVTDGDKYGGALPAPTTSPANFLATTIDDLFLGGDDITLSFAPVHAIGLYIISAEVTGDTLYDDDLLLSVGTSSALLDVDLRDDLGNDSYSYFLGLVDAAATFASARLTAATAAVGAIDFQKMFLVSTKLCLCMN
jgi:hypothetical protein